MKYISDMDQSNLYFGALATQDPASFCEMTQTRRKGINRLKNEKFNHQRNIGNEVTLVLMNFYQTLTETSFENFVSNLKYNSIYLGVIKIKYN